MDNLFRMLSPKGYVLPLHKKSGSIQLFILIALMTSLAVIITSIHFSMFSTVGQWKNAIQYQASIEVPTINKDGQKFTEFQIQKNQKRIMGYLKNSHIAQNATIMKQDDVSALLTPWLGEDNTVLDNITIPTVINFQLVDAGKDEVQKLKTNIQTIIPEARIQTHENWLDKFLDIMDGIHILGVMILIITFTATIFVISSSVRARMTIFKDELSLLHIMGAHDKFILKQFFLYLVSICVPACTIGYICASILLSLLSFSLLKSDIAFLPSFTLNISQFIALLIVPLCISVIALIIGAKTVLSEMQKMP